MEKIININGKDIRMKSTAGTFTRYRMTFKSDLLKDLVNLKERFEKVNNSENEQFRILDLQMFEQIAWALAKTADNSILPIENWLDEFETFDIYKIMPEMMELLLDNMQQDTNQKKNIIPEAVRNN